MKIYEIRFGNGMPIGLGMSVEECFLIQAGDMTEAMIRGIEVTDHIKQGLVNLGFPNSKIELLRLIGVVEQDPLLNPDNTIDSEYVKNLIESVKDSYSD